MVEPGRYGEPGPRVRTSPFLFGLLATAGGLVAIVGLLGLRRVGTVLLMFVAATYFAIGLDRPVRLMVRRGMRRTVAVGLIALAGLVLLVGAVGIAAIAGTAALSWSLIAGVPYPVLMAVVVALFDLIPQIGATIGSTVAILALPVSLGLAVAMPAYGSVQLLIREVLVPRQEGR